MLRIVTSDGPREAPLPQEREPLLAYLSEASILMVAAGMDVDRERPERGAVVPIGLVTDGSVVWPMDVLYYWENYGGEVSAEVLASARMNGFHLPHLQPDQVQQIRTEIQKRDSGEAVGAFPEIRADGANPFA